MEKKTTKISHTTIETETTMFPSDEPGSGDSSMPKSQGAVTTPKKPAKLKKTRATPEVSPSDELASGDSSIPKSQGAVTTPKKPAKLIKKTATPEVENVEDSPKKDKVKLLDKLEVKFRMFDTERSLDDSLDTMSPRCTPGLIKDKFKKYIAKPHDLVHASSTGASRTPTTKKKSGIEEAVRPAAASPTSDEIRKLDLIMEKSSGEFRVVSLDNKKPGPHCEHLLQEAQLWIKRDHAEINIVVFLKEFNNIFRIIRDRYRRAALIREQNNEQEWKKNMKLLAAYSVYALRMEEYWHKACNVDCTAVQICFLHEMSKNKLLNLN